MLRTICAVTEAGPDITNIQTRWTTGRTLVVIIEAILLLIGLVRAIEAFDCSRGFKFSTYAIRGMRQEVRRQRPRKQEHFESAQKTGNDAWESFMRGPMCDCHASDHDRLVVEKGLSVLDERSREIIRQRYLTGGKSVTLKDVGAALGFTKERVRQIQNDALATMREELQGVGCG